MMNNSKRFRVLTLLKRRQRGNLIVLKCLNNPITSTVANYLNTKLIREQRLQRGVRATNIARIILFNRVARHWNNLPAALVSAGTNK